MSLQSPQVDAAEVRAVSPSARLARWALAVADRLFGTDSRIDERASVALARYLAVAALLAAIIAVRRLDAITNPQFWSEDSTTYFYENLTLGFMQAFTKLWNGYPNLAQRLIAVLGGLVPFAEAPRVYTTAATVVTALALASFVLPGFRHVVRSDALRAFWGIAAISLPADQEMLATPTNLGWYLGIWLVLAAVQRCPARVWSTVLLALGEAVAVMSTPIAALCVPLWGFRCWRAIVRANRRELVVALTPLVAFAGVLAMSPNLGSDSAILRAVFEPEAVTTGKLTLVAQTVYLIVDRVLVLVLPPAVLAAVRSGLLTVQKAMVERLGAGAIVVDATLLALLAIGVVVAWSSRRFRRTVGLPLGLGGAIASLILTVQGRAGLLFLAREQIPIRYTIVPAALLALAAVAIVDALETSRQRLVATAGLAIVFACAWGAYFIVPPFVDYDWPTWAGRLEEKLASHSLEPLVIPMNPSWNPLRIDARLGPIDSGIAPRDIVHALGSRGTFRLLFTSKCDGISEVDLYLGTLAPTEQGTLVFELVNGGTTLKSITIPRGDVTSTGWRAFYFEPLRPSKDVPYLIRLRAVDNDGSASLVVLGESADTETQRRRDASLRYACSPPPGALRPGERVRL